MRASVCKQEYGADLNSLARFFGVPPSTPRYKPNSIAARLYGIIRFMPIIDMNDPATRSKFRRRAIYIRILRFYNSIFHKEFNNIYNADAIPFVSFRRLTTINSTSIYLMPWFNFNPIPYRGFSVFYFGLVRPNALKDLTNRKFFNIRPFRFLNILVSDRSFISRILFGTAQGANIPSQFQTFTKPLKLDTIGEINLDPFDNPATIPNIVFITAHTPARDWALGNLKTLNSYNILKRSNRALDLMLRSSDMSNYTDLSRKDYLKTEKFQNKLTNMLPYSYHYILRNSQDHLRIPSYEYVVDMEIIGTKQNYNKIKRLNTVRNVAIGSNIILLICTYLYFISFWLKILEDYFNKVDIRCKKNVMYSKLNNKIYNKIL
jgi:hypothetical protein